INRTHEKVLRFLPPYIIQKKHVDALIAALDRALSVGIEELSKKPKRNLARARRKEAAYAHA
ncbi:MAG: hypothetical protein WA609_02805, partial [Terriglobales bacterium]